MVRKVYQIKIHGLMSCFDTRRSILSKFVYVKYPNEDEIKKFKNKCCGNGLFDLNSERITVTIIELELVE